MNIGAQRIATKTRTWLFVAGLTALLIGIGALLGGMFLYAFVALAVMMNVFGYWYSDRLALQASRAQRVEPGTRPEIEAYQVREELAVAPIIGESESNGAISELLESRWSARAVPRHATGGCK